MSAFVLIGCSDLSERRHLNKVFLRKTATIELAGSKSMHRTPRMLRGVGVALIVASTLYASLQLPLWVQLLDHGALGAIMFSMNVLLAAAVLVFGIDVVATGTYSVGNLLLPNAVVYALPDLEASVTVVPKPLRFKTVTLGNLIGSGATALAKEAALDQLKRGRNLYLVGATDDLAKKYERLATAIARTRPELKATVHRSKRKIQIRTGH